MVSQKEDWVTLGDGNISGRLWGSISGKSSVLEGITGIPFPRQDGVCTRFATEIILRHQPGTNRITARILPAAARSEEDRIRMNAFERRLSSFDDLPRVIQEASVLMGIEDSTKEKSGSPAFTADVLRLEVIGDTGLHLTVVDLPGLISVSEHQEDVKIVEDIVDGYLESSRTIILTVVPAGSDIDTQGIIQRARKFDPAGLRTVGIITKPDLINKGTESRVASLAKNTDRVKLKLGFFLLKNPSPNELRAGISATERHQQEMSFFNSSPWKEQNLDKTRVGIQRLRAFLQQLLDSHIERELPKVRKDVEHVLSETERQLAQVGPERSSVAQIRMFLTQISMEFYMLTKAAVDGSYDGQNTVFFTATKKANARLRAKMHMENERFATHMRLHAAKRKICMDEDVSSESEQSASSEASQDSNVSIKGGQRLTKKQMVKWVEKIYHNTRGRELPGNYNHVLLSELFHEQCSPWGEVAKNHLQSVSSIVDQFVRTALDHIIADDQVRSGVRNRIRRSLDTNLDNAREELDKILSDEQAQPITYNHYYTDNIQNARADAARKQLQTSMDDAIITDFNGKLHVSNTTLDLQKLSSSLKTRVVVDMTQQACEESLAALNAYYKVANKTFVDNICRQVIERHLLRGLVKVFDPVCVSELSEEDLLLIAAETSLVRERRIELQTLRKALEESIQELRD